MTHLSVWAGHSVTVCKQFLMSCFFLFQGGESTRQEMCFAFLYYYPEMNLTYSVGTQTAGEEFKTQYLR